MILLPLQSTYIGTMKMHIEIVTLCSFLTELISKDLLHEGIRFNFLLCSQG